MVDIVVNATFDGINPVQNIGFTEPWSSGRINRYSVWDGDPANTLDFNGSLTGSDWRIRSMAVDNQAALDGIADSLTVTLTDLDSGGGRRIESLFIGGNADVDLLSTRIDWLRADSLGDHDINISNGGRIDYMSLGGDTNSVITGTNYVKFIEVWRGSADLTIGTGGAEAINLDNGNDAVVLNGFVESTRTDGGNDTVTVNSDTNSIRTKEGADTLNVTASGRVNFASMGDDADTVDVNGGEITSLVTGNGDDTVTVINGGRITQLVDWSGTTDITLSNDSRINSLQTDGDTNITLNDTSRIFQTK
ncbi:MAG: hypothetical protein AAFP16_14145, partial [Pseudomonadota bacterium]